MSVVAADTATPEVAPPSTTCVLPLLERWLQSRRGAALCSKAGYVPLTLVLENCPSIRTLVQDSADNLQHAIAAGGAKSALALDADHAAVRVCGLLERVRSAAEQHMAGAGIVSLQDLAQTATVATLLSAVPIVAERLQVLKDALGNSSAVRLRGPWIVSMNCKISIPLSADAPVFTPSSAILSADAPVFQPSWCKQPQASPKLCEFEAAVGKEADSCQQPQTSPKTCEISEPDEPKDVKGHEAPSQAPAEPDSEPEAEASPRTSPKGTREASELSKVGGEPQQKEEDEETSAAALQPPSPEGADREAARSRECAAPPSPEPATPLSWAAQQRMRRLAAAGQGQAEEQDVGRSIKSILNKLTIEKFEALSEKLLAIEFRTQAHMEVLIQEIFEKATMQHHFIEMYADLCVILHGFFTKKPVTADDPKFTFKRCLMNQCQASFERNLAPPAGLDDLDDEERIIQETKYKTRMVGNIRLVGVLLTRSLIPIKVMLAIFDELLSNPTSESLEAAAVLMSTVGPTFDQPTSGMSPIFTGLVVRMRDLAGSQTCDRRARCLLKDALELRTNGWESRRPKPQEQPTTLQEVAQRAAVESRWV